MLIQTIGQKQGMAAWSCWNYHETVSNRKMSTKPPPNCLDTNPTSFVYYLNDLHKILNPAVIKSNTLFKEAGRQPIVLRLSVNIQRDTCKGATVTHVIQRAGKNTRDNAFYVHIDCQ